MGYQPGSVTGWIEDLRKNDPEAQAAIWKRFVDRLVRLANRKMSGGGCRMADGEDVTNMAFANFFQQTPDHFERLMNRNDLWKILAMLTERRAIDQIRRENALKIGSGKVVSENVITKGDSRPPHGLDSFPGEKNTPDVELMLVEEASLRLETLDDNVLRAIAVKRMEGYPNKEIADKLQISLRSVERKLGQIRDIFSAASV